MIIKIEKGYRKKRSGSDYEFESISVINTDQITHIVQIVEEVFVDSECGIKGDGVLYQDQDSIIHFVGGTQLRVDDNTMQDIFNVMGLEKFEEGK